MQVHKYLYTILLMTSIQILYACGSGNSSTSKSPATCPYGTALADGCSGAPAGTPQLPHLLDVKQVTALNILTGSGYTNGTYTWTTTGGGGSGATGTITVSGGLLGGQNGLLYTVSNEGTNYASRPTIAIPAGASGGSGGSITPTVYQATPHNATTPWNMPGVDYYVGIPSGTALRDPTTGGILPSGATLSGNMITITGCNVTLDKFDFTLHNTAITVNVSGSGCTTTIQNSKQSAAAASAPTLYPIALLSSMGDGGTFVYKYNEYDGLAPYGVSGGSGYAVNDPLHSSNVTQLYYIDLEYNYFHNFDSKVIQISGATSYVPNLTEKYNLFFNYANCGTSCAHGEAENFYYGGGTSASLTAQFNTYYKQHLDNSTSNLTALQAVMAENMIINPVYDDHNVLFAQGPQVTCPGVDANQNPYLAAADVFDGSQNSNSATNELRNGDFNHNYLDSSGAYKAWYHVGNIYTTTWTNNVDAGTGNACN